MTIHKIVIEEPDVYITQAEMDRLRLLWQSEQSMTVCHVSFETWLRNKIWLRNKMRRDLADRK